MATALDIVEGMFEVIGVIAAETPIEASMGRSALTIINDLGVEWELMGANLGFAPVNDLADEIRIPRGAHAAFKYNGGARLAPIYEVVLSQENVSIANNTLRNMMAIYRKPIESVYPSTLPMGSGEQCSDDYLDSRFYPNVEKENF